MRRQSIAPCWTSIWQVIWSVSLAQGGGVYVHEGDVVFNNFEQGASAASAVNPDADPSFLSHATPLLAGGKEVAEGGGVSAEGPLGDGR